MAYNDDLSWVVLANEAGATGRNALRSLRDGRAVYDKWQNFRNSRTNAQIAVALGRTEAEVAEMDSCFAVFKELDDFADNVAAPVQSDRKYSLRKFS